MAQDTSSIPDQSHADSDRDLRLHWTPQLSLRARILAINIFVIALFAGGLFYLDSFRARLVETRTEQLARETGLIARTIEETPAPEHPKALAGLADATGLRIRLFAPDDSLVGDSSNLTRSGYTLIDPDSEPFRKDVARAMDRTVDWVTRTRVPETLASPDARSPTSWPEVAESRNAANTSTRYRLAPDRTPFISAARPVGTDGSALLVTTNARDITRTVRSERLSLALLFFATLVASILLSLFLARTIVKPLQRLMRAAVRVRWGRERDVTVPRLPGRNDEIGLLARALSDMTQSLRERIDAGEHFAADVAHELKNPISSLRSSIEALETIDDADLRRDLLAVARDDCRRLDRLVTDISEASRMDAELSRAHFERVDIGSMIDSMVSAREARQQPHQPRIAFARPRKGSTDVMGDDNRLERVFGNLLDNAESFSPRDGIIRISATRSGEEVIVRIEDDGPGVPAAHRSDIFHRFYSLRPAGEQFGKHSGLGLAIVSAIVTGHQGTVAVGERDDGERGACFVIRLPAAPEIGG